MSFSTEQRPLTWERNEVDLLLLEGYTFECPWTGKHLSKGSPYDLDHLVPVALYPTNGLWNLVPADRDFNQRVKRDRLPSAERLREAEPRLAATFGHYFRSSALGSALLADVRGRFVDFPTGGANGNVTDVVGDTMANMVARAAAGFVATAADVRNTPRFG